MQLTQGGRGSTAVDWTCFALALPGVWCRRAPSPSARRRHRRGTGPGDPASTTGRLRPHVVAPVGPAVSTAPTLPLPPTPLSLCPRQAARPGRARHLGGHPVLWPLSFSALRLFTRGAKGDEGRLSADECDVGAVRDGKQVVSHLVRSTSHLFGAAQPCGGCSR